MPACPRPGEPALTRKRHVWIERLAGESSRASSERCWPTTYAAAVAGEDADLAWAEKPDERDDSASGPFALRLPPAIRPVNDLRSTRRSSSMSRPWRWRPRTRTEPAARGDGDDHAALFHMDEALSGYFAAVDEPRDVDPPTPRRTAWRRSWPPAPSAGAPSSRQPRSLLFASGQRSQGAGASGPIARRSAHRSGRHGELGCSRYQPVAAGQAGWRRLPAT